MSEEKICGIYCIENIINGKKYIGQSINIFSRGNNILTRQNLALIQLYIML